MTAVAKKKPAGFAARLRQLREKAGLTQAELADAADVKRLTIIRYESGESEPSWSVAVMLAAALGVEPNDFLDG